MRKVWIWALSLIAVLAVSLSVAGWYLSRNWKVLVEEKLATLVQESTQGLYKLTYDDLDINPAIGNVTFRNLVFRADTNVYRLLEGQQKAANNLYDVEMKTLQIKRFSIIDLIKDKGLRIKSIALGTVKLQLTQKYHAYNDTLQHPGEKDFRASLKKVLAFVDVKDIRVDSVYLNYVKQAEDGKETFKIAQNGISLQVKDFLIDGEAQADSSQLFYAKMIALSMPKFNHNFPKGLYKGGFSSLGFNTQEKTLVLAGVYYEPTMPRSTYYGRTKVNKTLVSLRADSLRLEGFDFMGLLAGKGCVTEKMFVRDGTVKFYGDKRFPKKPVNQIGRAPHQQLMKFGMALNLKEIFLDNIDIEYTEMGAKYHREGTITFNDTRGTLSNVTNDSLILQKNRFMKADLKTKVMNSGPLAVLFNFDMLSTKGAYTYKGHVDPMKAPAFNKILQPILNFEIASGNIRKIRFDMQGTDRHTTGNFWFDYDNLKVKLPDIQKENGKKTSGKVVSFLVNQILINDSNPDANEIYHTGKISYPRDPSYTFFKNLWKSLLEGIKQTAGIDKEREQKLIGKAEATKEIVSDGKQAVKKTGLFIKKLFKKKDRTAEKED